MNRTHELKKLMERHGLTAKAVAQILNRKPATVFMWRTGTFKIIPEHTLAVLRNHLEKQSQT